MLSLVINNLFIDGCTGAVGAIPTSHCMPISLPQPSMRHGVSKWQLSITADSGKLGFDLRVAARLLLTQELGRDTRRHKPTLTVPSDLCTNCLVSLQTQPKSESLQDFLFRLFKTCLCQCMTNSSPGQSVLGFAQLCVQQEEFLSFPCSWCPFCCRFFF